jgi:hypothetical protein
MDEDWRPGIKAFKVITMDGKEFEVGAYTDIYPPQYVSGSTCTYYIHREGNGDVEIMLNNGVTIQIPRENVAMTYHVGSPPGL